MSILHIRVDLISVTRIFADKMMRTLASRFPERDVRGLHGVRHNPADDRLPTTEGGHARHPPKDRDRVYGAFGAGGREFNEIKLCDDEC